MDNLFKRKQAFLVLLSLLIFIVAISSASAAEGAINEDLSANEAPADVISVDEADISISDNALKSENNDVIDLESIEEDSDETLAGDVNEVAETSPNTLAGSENEEIISEESDEEILSSPVASSYSVKVDVNNIQLEYGVVIPINITPYDGDDYAYDFYLRIFNSTGSQIYDKNLYSYTPVNYLSHTVDVYLNPGTYTIKLINYQDGELMDTATFTMTGEYLPPSFAKIDDISIEVDEEIVLPIRINPNPNEYYAYDFNLDIYDSFGDLVYSENIYSSTMRTNLNYTVDMWLDVGTYTIELTNYTGGAFLDTAILTILDHPTQYATFTISQSGTYYNSKYVTVKLINTDTNLPIKNCGVALKFSNGKTVTVTTNSNGVATYKVPFDAGTYKVKAVSTKSYIKGESADLTVNILKHPGTITISQSGKYYKDKKITVKLYDSATKSVVKGQYVKIKFSNGKTVNVKTNSNGIASYKVDFKPGKYTATASFSNKNYAFASKSATFKILKVPVKIDAKKFKAGYDSGKYYKIKVINKATKKGVKGVKLKIKIKGAKTFKRTTKAGGKVSFDASKYKVGKHKVTIKVLSKKFHTGKTKKSSILIKKGKASIYAPETINCLKRDENYTIHVYNNKSYRPVKYAKVSIKVYTGKKVKTYTRKTDADGAARFNTKSLKKGKHKVVVSLKANKKYKKAKAQGSVEISKKIPTNIGYYLPLHYQATSTTIYFGGYYGYTTTHVYAVGVDVYLRDKNGHDLYGKKVKVTHSNGNFETGLSGDRIYVSGSNSGSITLSFAGDRKYMPSTYTFYLS